MFENQHNTSPAPSVFPLPPGPVHLVGIGGIGMSGLAQLLRRLGYAVTGSDRDLSGPGRDRLYRRLRAQRIRVGEQDGSIVAAFRPRAVVCSAAIEPGNPDLAAAAGILVFGRAAALAAVLDRLPGKQIAIAGSAGKTSVTAWTASALKTLGRSVLMLTGGCAIDFETGIAPGNFAADPAPEWIVYETDESDGSLVAFHPDISVILNMGTDHHSRGRLTALFSRFASNCTGNVVLHTSLAGVVDPGKPLERVLFFGGQTPRAPAVRHISGPEQVRTTQTGIAFVLPGLGHVAVRQFGRHSAENACAVFATLEAALGHGMDRDAARAALGTFGGVRRRFEKLGVTRNGIPIIVDYAHNIEKISCALEAARELAPNRLLAVFQPHGYGPLGFMRDALVRMLATTLRAQDTFVFLPVYYAGGTTSFSPTSAQVAAEAAAAGAPVLSVANRRVAGRLIRAEHDRHGAILVMGARDPSLPDWARTFVEKESSRSDAV